MRAFGLSGRSGSGKTTLLVRLLPILAARGVSVSTVKHTHHDVDLDQPGKDSWRHREAGAREVIVAGAHRWALLHERRDDSEVADDLAALAARLAPVDLLLVEGFHRQPLPRLEVYRPANGQPPLWPADPGILALATEPAEIARLRSDSARPVFSLEEPEPIATFILERASRI